jgi:hypothetical protein
MSYFVQSGEGRWDYSIYGRVKDQKLNDATMQWINRIYFSQEPTQVKLDFMETTDLGFDPSHDQIYFLLIGQLRHAGNEDIEKWLYAFLVFADHRLRPSTGLMTHDESLIRILSHTWETAERKCKSVDNYEQYYWRLDLCQQELPEIKRALEEGILKGSAKGAPHKRWA